MLQLAPTTRARSSRSTGRAEANSAASTRPIHSRQRAAGGRSSSSRSSSPPFFPLRAIARARRAGTSRVRSVRGSRRARRAVRNSRRVPRSERPAIGVAAASKSWSSSACSAALAPFARSFGAASASFCARRRSSAARSQACAAPLAQANRTRVVSAPSPFGRPRAGPRTRTAARRAAAARTAISVFGRARNRRARPRGVPRRRRGRPPSVAAERARTSARRRTAPAERRRRKPRAASIAACNASSPGRSKASAATAIAERHCPDRSGRERAPGPQPASRRSGIGARTA